MTLLWKMLLGCACTSFWSAGVLAQGLGGLTQAVDTPRPADGVAENLTLTFDLREDYRALSFGFQPDDRLEIGISFPTYDDGGESSSGTTLGLGFRLLNEGQVLPGLSAGIVGFGSDDRASGEYIVADKTIGPLQAALGLGWGRYAVQNGPRRGADDGTFRTDHLFMGASEAFASIVWATGVEGLSAAAEYSGLSGRKADDTYAFALQYEVFDGLTISGQINNQASAGLRLAFEVNPAWPPVQGNIGPGPHPYVENTAARAQRPQQTQGQILSALQERLEKENIKISRFAMDGSSIDVTASAPDDGNFARTAGRVARVLSALAPAQVTTFRVTQNTGAFDSAVIVMDRAGLDRAIGQPDAAERAWEATTLQASPLDRPAAHHETEFTPRLSYGIAPAFKADFVTSDTLELTGTLSAFAGYELSPQTRIEGRLGYRFVNQWTQVDPPAEPAIRTDLTSYSPDRIYLQSLTASHRFRLAPAVYSRISTGYFERAYAGVSAEVIWRAPEQDIAFGLETTFAQKRSYDDWFGFEDAEATTVIGSVYANIGQNGDFLIVDAGQYLAGDFAVGVTVGRNYSNGWRVAGATIWSAQSDAPLKFGAALSIPFSLASPEATNATTDVTVGGPSGEFGSRVGGTGLLYDELRRSDRKRTEDAWGEFWN